MKAYPILRFLTFLYVVSSVSKTYYHDLTTGQRRKLNGNYYLRHTIRRKTTSPKTEVLNTDDRLLYMESPTCYQEGVVLKVQSGGEKGRNRLCISMKGATQGKWISDDDEKIIMRPLRPIKNWVFLSGILRCIHDFPLKLNKIITEADEGARASNLKKEIVDDFPCLVREHDLQRELTSTWMSYVGDHMNTLHPHLISKVSQTFASKVAGRNITGVSSLEDSLQQLSNQGDSIRALR